MGQWKLSRGRLEEHSKFGLVKIREMMYLVFIGKSVNTVWIILAQSKRV